VDPLGTCSQDANGNYLDGDDAGTFVASGPCARSGAGALSVGIATSVSVKPGSADEAWELAQPFLAASEAWFHAQMIGAGNGGPIVSAAPPPWYRNSCVTGALLSGFVHVGIDAIGLLPEGGLVSRAIGNFGGWRGIVATQQGIKGTQALKMGAGIVSSTTGANESSTLGVTQTANNIAGVVSTLAGAVPVVGQVIAGVSVALDGIKAGVDVWKCY
jgi:hypothetical protein